MSEQSPLDRAIKAAYAQEAAEEIKRLEKLEVTNWLNEQWDLLIGDIHQRLVEANEPKRLVMVEYKHRNGFFDGSGKLIQIPAEEGWLIYANEQHFGYDDPSNRYYFLTADGQAGSSDSIPAVAPKGFYSNVPDPLKIFPRLFSIPNSMSHAEHIFDGLVNEIAPSLMTMYPHIFK